MRSCIGAILCSYSGLIDGVLIVSIDTRKTSSVSSRLCFGLSFGQLVRIKTLLLFLLLTVTLTLLLLI